MQVGASTSQLPAVSIGMRTASIARPVRTTAGPAPMTRARASPDRPAVRIAPAVHPIDNKRCQVPGNQRRLGMQNLEEVGHEDVRLNADHEQSNDGIERGEGTRDIQRAGRQQARARRDFRRDEKDHQRQCRDQAGGIPDDGPARRCRSKPPGRRHQQDELLHGKGRACRRRADCASAASPTPSCRTARQRDQRPEGRTP